MAYDHFIHANSVVSTVFQNDKVEEDDSERAFFCEEYLLDHFEHMLYLEKIDPLQRNYLAGSQVILNTITVYYKS